MTLLIADSGSTKTDWRLVHHNGVQALKTEGYNPYHLSSEEIIFSLHNNIVNKLEEARPEQIYFYGAGCTDGEKKMQIHQALSVCFPHIEIFVESDLLGASRALHGNHEGFTGILGTGSNSCMYDGEKVVRSVAPLGYIVGDEGSGTHIGKAIIRECLRGKFPEELEKKFLLFCRLNREEILEKIYRQPNPGQFLSSLSMFAFEHINHDKISLLIHHCLADYFNSFVMPYQLKTGYGFGFVGSIAFYFTNELKTVIKEHGFKLNSVLQSPIDELVKYHTR